MTDATQIHFFYSASDTGGGSNDGWQVDLGINTVRLGGIGLAMSGEMGTPATCQVSLDDLSGTLGHSGDHIAGWRQFHMYDYRASTTQPVVSCFIQKRTYRRDVTRSAITGATRIIDVDLIDVGNEILNLKIITGADGNRPAETDVARVTWILGASYTPSISNALGLFSSANPVAMDANDYRGQTVRDVINDCALQSAKNYCGIYDGASRTVSLFYDLPASTAWDSSRFLSNALSDLGAANTFQVERDAALVRDPSRVVSGVYETYKGSKSVYVTNATTALHFYPRDGNAPNKNITNAATAAAQATLFLNQHDEEDDRITCIARVPVANVLDIRPFQLVQAKFTHLPGYESYTKMRVLQIRYLQTPTDDIDYYRLGLDLSPIAAGGGGGTSTFAIITQPDGGESTSDNYNFPTMHWDWDGDSPHTGDPMQPKTGLIAYNPAGSKPGTGWTGLKVSGAGTVTARATFDTETVAGNQSATMTMYKNGVSVGSQSFSTTGGLHAWVQVWDLSVTFTVVSGDVITVGIVFDNGGTGATIPAAGPFYKYLSVTGTLS